MHLRNSLFPILAMALASCGGNAPSAPKAASPQSPKVAAVAPGAAANNYTYTLYRPVHVIGETNHVDWSAVSFGVMGPVPALGFYDSMDDHSPPNEPPACWVRISVTVQGAPPPLVGSNATLATPTPPVQGAQPGPWAVQFDNVPAGHWSLLKDQIAGSATPVSNRQAGTLAGETFQQLVEAGQATVLPGAYPNCAP